MSLLYPVVTELVVMRLIYFQIDLWLQRGRPVVVVRAMWLCRARQERWHFLSQLDNWVEVLIGLKPCSGSDIK